MDGAAPCKVTDAVLNEAACLISPCGTRTREARCPGLARKTTAPRAIKFAMLVVSLTALSLLFLVAFIDPDNATRLFVSGDGAYVRTLARQQFEWFGMRPGNFMNFWQGATNVYPYNAAGVAVFAGQFLLTGAGDLDPVTTYATAAAFLFIAGYLAAFFIALPLGYSIATGWILALLALPLFGDWHLYPAFVTNPNLAEAVLAECLILRLMFLMGRASLISSVPASAAIVLLICHQAFFNSLHFVIIVPVVGAFSLLFIVCAMGRELRHKLIGSTAIVISLLVIGAPQYILGNALYTISGMLMADLDPSQITMHYVSVAFYWASYGKLLGPLLVAAAVIGAACIVMFQRGMARAVAILCLAFMALYVGAGSLVPGSAWMGPMPIYFEIALYPFYAALAAASALYTMQGVRRMVTGTSVALPAPARVMLCASPLLLLPLSYAPPWRTGYAYPPVRTDIIRMLEAEAALAPGGPFRGYVAPYLGFRDRPPGDKAMDPFVDAELPLSAATGNDHRSIGLWYFNIPGLIEISSLATPPYFLLATRLLARHGDPQFRHGAKLTRIDLPILQAIGVRFIVTDFPLEAPALLRATMATASPKIDELRVYETPHPNLGQYSPTRFVVATSARATLLALGAEADLQTTVIVTEPLPGDLKPAKQVVLSADRRELNVRAESPGQSVLLIPIQFSRCLRLAGASDSARLIRANLMQTGVLFSGAIDATIELRNGPFASPDCRLRDYWDMRQLDVAGAAREIPRR